MTDNISRNRFRKYKFDGSIGGATINNCSVYKYTHEKLDDSHLEKIKITVEDEVNRGTDWMFKFSTSEYECLIERSARRSYSQREGIRFTINLIKELAEIKERCDQEAHERQNNRYLL